jgi:prepilin-type N-terminal cleavage/methylation domain-containing protein
MKRTRRSGFTLVEIMVVMAIIGILGALAVVLYSQYVTRARASDIVVKYDGARSKAGANIAGDTIVERCDEVLNSLGPLTMDDDYARLSYLFEADNDGRQAGYRPVMTVCARAAKQGAQSVKITRAAHDELAKRVTVENGAVLTESIVSYALPLTPKGKVVCMTPVTSNNYTACGDVIASVMKFSGSNTYVRPAGGRLDTGGPLRQFSLDMSFIGDGSIPAASGGQGPVMFNYGDASNSHNAISLWNPRSLTVAIMGKDYDTGLNVVDGNTHRVTTTWDGATGTLKVYDNGKEVKSFSGVYQGGSIPGGGFMTVAHKGEPGQYSASESFAGQVFHTSFANVAVSAQQATNPLNQGVDRNSGMLADFRAQGGQVVDTTGRNKVETGGVTTVQTGVDSGLVGGKP